MITIKKTTKKGQVMIAHANNYLGSSLNDVYANYSNGKAQAMKYCKEQCYNENGSNFRIISYNTFGFSVAWNTEKGLRIETPQNSYLVA